MVARRWNKEEEDKYRTKLILLYVKRNKSIKEVGKILCIAEQTVFQRMRRLGIPTRPELKKGYLNKRLDIVFPLKSSYRLGEFFGIMLGDGHVSHFQTTITLGTKEMPYVRYVASVMKKLFMVSPGISRRKGGYHDIYISSVALAKWLYARGLVSNKVHSQVGIPAWIFSKKTFMKGFLRGLFDTDGSVYLLKYGIQVSFTNYSYPLLKSLHSILSRLRYNPSKISSHKVYITNRKDVVNFFKEISPKNPKHKRRFEEFKKMRRSYSGYYTRL